MEQFSNFLTNSMQNFGQAIGFTVKEFLEYNHSEKKAVNNNCSALSNDEAYFPL